MRSRLVYVLYRLTSGTQWYCVRFGHPRPTNLRPKVYISSHVFLQHWKPGAGPVFHLQQGYMTCPPAFWKANTLHITSIVQLLCNLIADF